MFVSAARLYEAGAFVRFREGGRDRLVSFAILPR